MRFGRSLHSQLLRMTPAGSTAPVRAYGKLEVASEFIEVGCDERPEASSYRNWVREGWKRLEIATHARPLRVRDLRLALSADRGRVWIIACLWDSADRRSEQGHQRVYPFTLFVVVPAPRGRRPFGTLVAFCSPIWAQIDALRPQLLQTADRAACAAFVRSASVTLPDDAQLETSPTSHAVDGRPLHDWAAALYPDAGDSASLLLALARHAERLRRHRGRLRPFWRLPLAADWPTEAQVAVWVRWLQANFRHLDTFAAFLPPAATAAGEFLIVGESARPDDFLATAADEGVLVRLAPPLPMEPVAGAEDDLPQRIARHMPAGGTLGEFATMRLPGS